MAYQELDALKPFKPSSKYNHDLDVLTYRSRGGTCIADRVDPFLTILWDKDQTDLVGVKLKGFRYYFNELKGKKGWNDTDFLPLVSVLEAVVADGLGDQILDEQREKYELAKECVRQFHLTKEELRQLESAA